ncbi:Ccr4-NOT transcription complex subunit 3,related protein [Toxoplasma gondii FOU]|uniref:Ccr4-NOT transcription complex subunit 3,related protein n=2 Tax=Toxoplasma gondii TaxID=5811 RepID=A0A086JZQ5_TOXGO|nr:Ccr4-NOT transcription complex subunit 3,related protein [Toxoplasma gondii FOU]PUA84990.1 Ccr4-NOT transcription complex subunit 3,related protein [Toxoplasma gondii TgCATBr9]
MALKKLHTEVEKALREVRACIDAYDERWQELLEFNRQFLERPDHLDEAKKDVLRGKKHSVKTATLELVDIKHANDTKARIEADLEGCLRKLHRLKQQLSDWLHNYSDKDIRNKAALVELRKSIELLTPSV